MASPRIDPSLHQQIGGRVALTAAVDEFYRGVLGDAALATFFAGTDRERLRRHQAAFLAAALGGSSAYEGLPLRQAHAGRGIGRGTSRR